MKVETVSRQIKYVEDVIKIKEKKGKDVSFEKGLIKSWERFKKEHGDTL